MTRTLTGFLVGSLLVLAGCAAKETSPPSDSTPKSPSVHGSLAECLHAHGMPQATGPALQMGPPDGVDPAVWDTAMQSCASLAPGPGPTP